jgi:hypothetical protein
MVYFILVWTILVVAGYLTGLLVMNWLAPESFGRWSDRFIASIWLGIIAIGVFLLATSLVLPLSPLVGAGAIACLAVLSLLLPQTRGEIARWRDRVSSATFGKALLLGAIAAGLTTYEVTWIESGFYHYNSMRWLSEFGTVPGTVLILPNLGIISAWFALNTPFNGAVIEFRAGAIANGFLFYLALLHTGICLARILNAKGKLSDYFAASFYILFFAYTALSIEMQLVLVSPSPDLPIILLAGIAAWAILVTTESRKVTQSSQPELRNDSVSKIASFRSKIVLEGAIVPLLLAAGAVTIKLSALPILFVAGLFYAVHSRFKVRAILWAITLTGLLLIPIFVVGLQTSGCPLYPSPFLCLDVPWSQSGEDTQQFADRTSNPVVWAGQTPAGQNQIIWALSQWFKARALNQLMAVLVILSLFCGIYLIQQTAIARRNLGIFWLLGLGTIGNLFIIFRGPLIRFGLGYLLLLPALVIAVYSQKKWGDRLLESTSAISSTKWRQIQLIIFILLGSLFVFSFSYGGIASRWLLPPPVTASPVIPKQVYDVKYFNPKEGACWALNLPCTPQKFFPKAKLRDPKLGIKGGFVRPNRST